MTRKQELFIREYLIDLNATQAAIRAGYKARNAGKIGSQLLAKSRISAAIDDKKAKREQRLDLSGDRVLRELMKLAFLDPRKFYREDGSLKAITELDEDTAAALAGFEVEEAYEHFGKGQAKPNGLLKKIKFADKGLNLERLGRHLKLFTDKVEFTGLEDLAAEVQKARLRAQG